MPLWRLITIFTFLVDMMALIGGTISLSLILRRISGLRYCLLIIRHLHLATGTLPSSIRGRYTYSGGMTVSIELMISIDIVLTRASGACRRSLILRLVPRLVIHTLPLSIIINCTFLEAMMDTTATICTSSILDKGSGLRSEEMDFGQSQGTGLRPPSWDNECTCLEGTMVHDN